MDNSNTPDQLQPNKLDQRQLKSAQNQITFAYVAAPLSLFFGGMLLGALGLIFAILAYRKLHQLERKSNVIAQSAVKLKRSAKIAVAFCLVAVVINGVSMYLMLPVILDMIQNGQISPTLSTGDIGSEVGTSTWG